MGAVHGGDSRQVQGRLQHGIPASRHHRPVGRRTEAIPQRHIQGEHCFEESRPAGRAGRSADDVLCPARLGQHRQEQEHTAFGYQRGHGT